MDDYFIIGRRFEDGHWELLFPKYKTFNKKFLFWKYKTIKYEYIFDVKDAQKLAKVIFDSGRYQDIRIIRDNLYRYNLIVWENDKWTDQITEFSKTTFFEGNC